MNSISKLSRRRFLQLTGVSASGLVLGGILPVGGSLAGVLDRPAGNELNIFVSVTPEGTVEIIAHRSEMGTGIRTSLPQVVADEMEADWHRVKVIQGLANTEYGSQNTDGSRSVRDFYTVMRQMGAMARQMLEQAAADTWDVSPGECVARDHAVHHANSDRQLGFGELAQRAARLETPEPASVVLKSADDFRYIGSSIPIVDLQDMTMGKAVYGVDVHLPDMLYASIERSPWLQGSITSYDASEARKIKGVLDVVELKAAPGPPGFNPVEGLAVIATNTFSALRGREKLSINWSRNPHSEHNSAGYLDELARRVEGGPGKVQRERGDVDAALAAAETVVEASYRTPYLAHAS
ncbi:MAG TPA: molybdopterin cofactor-binding domain-containing protein, partial [Kineobactrum sp.]